MSEEEIISTRPLDENEKLLQKKFYEDIAAQSERADALSAHLLTLELAIPGVYATALKLVRGGDATLHHLGAIRWTFGFWFIALILTLIALTPRKWKVNPRVFEQDKSLMKKEGLGIKDYFHQSAKYKRYFALTSSFFFFVGIMIAVFTI